jgi:lipid-A-disaccharide synthase-like uncharacterized protein
VKVISDIVFSVAISIEFLVICVGSLLTVRFPDLLRTLGTGLDSHKEAFQWLSIGCAGVLLFGLRCAHEILVPKHPNSEVLANWTGFYMLKNRTLTGVFYVIAGACVAVTIWMFNADIRDPKTSAAYYASVAIVMISALNLWYANVQLGIRLRRVRNDKTSN